jgi:DNA transposition AAA+ family ATPase
MYNKEQKTAICEAVKQKIADKKISQSVAGNQIGISAAYVNHIVNNKVEMFDTISEQMWRTLAIWSNYEANQGWGVFESDNLNSISSLCNEAQEDCRFMAIIAETGYGKTAALERYARTRPERTFYVLCIKTMNRRDFLAAILKSIGLEIEGSIHTKVTAIANFFKLNSHCLLILDDVGKLNESCLSLIQIIYDMTVGLAGIVVAGLPSFKKWFFKMAAKDRPGFRELKRRIEYWLPLNKISKAFIVPVAHEFGITEEPAIRFLLDNCHDYGTFRNMIENYTRAVKKNAKLTQREVLAGIHIGTKDMEG